MSKKVVCPFCFHRVTPDPDFKGCPEKSCKFHERRIPFPQEILEGCEVFPIAIAGASSSGKTYFLTALLNEFQNNPFWDGDGENLCQLGFYSDKFQALKYTYFVHGAEQDFRFAEEDFRQARTPMKLIK